VWLIFDVSQVKFVFVLFVAAGTLAIGCATLHPVTSRPASSQPAGNAVHFEGSFIIESNADVKPRLLSPVAAELEAKGVTGWAILALVVDASGAPTQVQFVRASTRTFGEIAVAAARRWKFSPAQKEGRPVPCKIELPLDFSIG
jgi:TonB family protein